MRNLFLLFWIESRQVRERILPRRLTVVCFRNLKDCQLCSGLPRNQGTISSKGLSLNATGPRMAWTAQKLARLHRRVDYACIKIKELNPVN